MASLKKELNHFAKSLTIYFIVFCMAFHAPLSVVMAQPSEGVFVVGGGPGSDITYGPTTTVTVDNIQSVVEWGTPGSPGTGGIDTAANETLAFAQNGVVDGAVLNRVMSGNMSDFQGHMTAEVGMDIFVINQAGILFGPNSTINVTRLVASGLNITNEDFIADSYQFDEIMNSDASVINEGIITTDKGAALIGRMVKNSGTISAGSNGLIVMAAGDSVLLREPGSEIIIQLEGDPPPDPLVEVTSVSEGAAQTEDFSPGDVVNDGTLTTNGGAIILAAGDTFAAVLQDLDFLEIPIIEATGGTGRVFQSGQLHADNTILGRGGLVNMTAPDLVRLDSTSLTTANAGGEIGNGGVILARSEKLTEYLEGARIEARSGTNPIDGGEGGVVDLSGNHVLFEGDVLGGDIDILGSEFVTIEIPDEDPVVGSNPNRGVFIIDPITLTVRAGDKPVDPPADVIYEADIEAFSEVGVDVVLTADFDLTVETLRSGDAGDLGLEGGIGDLVFRNAYDAGSITFDTGDLISTDNGGSIFMLGGDGRDNGGVGLEVGDISTFTAPNDKITEPGKIRLLTVRPVPEDPEEIPDGGDMITGSLMVDGGSFVEISAIAAGNLTVIGDVISMTNQVPAKDQRIGQARICLVANENIDVTADKILVEAHGKKETNAEVIICAGETVTISDTSEISALAKTSENQEGSTADAQVSISAGWNIEGNDGTITINGIVYDTDGDNSAMPISATAQVSGAGTPASVDAGDLVDDTAWEDTDSVGHAEINVDDAAETGPEDPESPCNDCPKPPVLPPQPTPGKPPIAEPGFHIVHMNTIINDDASDLVDDPDMGDDLNFTQGTFDTTLGGSVTINEDGTYEYTPLANTTGQDTFEYTVSDGENEVTGIIIVELTNTAPNADPDSDSTHMNTGFTFAGSVLDNDADSDSDPITELLLVDDVNNGTLTFDPDTGEFSYTPNASFAGEDTFTYSITDGELIDGTTPAAPVTALVTISVTNAAPTPTNDTASTHGETPVTGNVLNTTNPDTDPDGDPFVIVGNTQPSNGALTFNSDTGEFEYLPAIGFLGVDTFTYSVTDGEQGADPVYATVTINVGNLSPIASDDNYTVMQGTPLTISDLLGILLNDTDPDGDSLTPGLVSAPSNGGFVLNQDGSFSYVPDAGFFGEDSLVYAVTDKFGGSSEAIVTITVNQIIIPEPTPADLLPPAPLPALVGIEISGCPASMDAAATEIGTTTQTLQISIAKAMSTTPNVQPCSACETLVDQAAILRDSDGRYMAAMIETFNIVAPSNVPYTPAMGASITTAFATNTGNPDSPQFATAMEFMDAFVTYVAVVETELGAPLDDSTAYVMDKYGAVLTEAQNANIAAYVTSRIQTGG